MKDEKKTTNGRTFMAKHSKGKSCPKTNSAPTMLLLMRAVTWAAMKSNKANPGFVCRVMTAKVNWIKKPIKTGCQLIFKLGKQSV